MSKLYSDNIVALWQCGVVRSKVWRGMEVSIVSNIYVRVYQYVHVVWSTMEKYEVFERWWNKEKYVEKISIFVDFSSGIKNIGVSLEMVK